MKINSLIVILVSLITCYTTNAQQDTYKIIIEPKFNEKFARAEYTLWIPEGEDLIERIILHQHGCGDNAQNAGKTATDDLHWRLLAEKTNSALLGSSLWPTSNCGDWSNPDNGTGRAFLQALEKLSVKSGHPEIATVNWIVWGHSGGGFWAQEMLQKHPNRFDAVILQSPGLRTHELRGTEMTSLPYPRNVPMMIHTGLEEKGHERFNGTYQDAIILFAKMRQYDAPVTLVIDPASGHGTGNSRYLTIPWIAAVINGNKEAETIRPYEHSEHGNWFPDQIIVAKWEVFSQLGNVPDFTPPELAPFDLKATNSDRGIELSWKAIPDWESGIKTFRVYRDGVLIKSYVTPDKDEGEFTEYFRKPNFSDTPSPPLARMEYLDAEVKSHKTYKYQVSFVNWSGLESPKSQIAEITFVK